jgi:hypothetical protein
MSGVQASGTFAVDGRTVHRLGFGATRLTGEGSGTPPDRRPTAGSACASCAARSSGGSS